jgi:predicted metal-dependent hydrolase
MFPVRRFEEDFSTLPRWWFGGDPGMTHAINGMNLVFPDGERFFIRSVRRYLDRITDPELRSRVQLFSGQEGQHGAAHERQFAALESQGFELESWMRWYRWAAYEVIEPAAPPILRLAATVALEHYTASFARVALETDLLDPADPAMASLLKWHAAEEVEHRAVAYDVYVAVGGGYFVRVLGLVLATATLLFFWQSGTRHLMKQEGDLSKKGIALDRTAAREARARRVKVIREALLSYLRPGFHPDDVDDGASAAQYLASIGRLHA